MGYNATVEVDVNPTTRRPETWMDALAAYSPAVGQSARGRSEITITVPGKTFEQAVITSLRLLTGAAGQQMFSLTVLPTVEFDRRAGDVHVPELVSATEAAAMLGVSRQRVQQMAADGALPAHHVASTLAFARASVEMAAATGPQGGDGDLAGGSPTRLRAMRLDGRAIDTCDGLTHTCHAAVRGHATMPR